MAAAGVRAEPDQEVPSIPRFPVILPTLNPARRHVKNHLLLWLRLDKDCYFFDDDDMMVKIVNTGGGCRLYNVLLFSSSGNRGEMARLELI